NAYFTGVGRHKRIVFLDTLLAKLDPPEIEAVLAHELGHFRLNHVRHRLVASALLSLAGLALLAALAPHPAFYAALGVPTPSAHAALLLFVICAPAFTFFGTPLAAWWSRKHELEADDFAVEHTSARDLASALVKLYRDNAANLTPDRFYSAFYDTHPPALVRGARLRAIPVPSGSGPAAPPPPAVLQEADEHGQADPERGGGRMARARRLHAGRAGAAAERGERRGGALRRADRRGGARLHRGGGARARRSRRARRARLLGPGEPHHARYELARGAGRRRVDGARRAARERNQALRRARAPRGPRAQDEDPAHRHRAAGAVAAGRRAGAVRDRDVARVDLLDRHVRAPRRGARPAGARADHRPLPRSGRARRGLDGLAYRLDPDGRALRADGRDRERGRARARLHGPRRDVAVGLRDGAGRGRGGGRSALEPGRAA